MRRSAPMRSTSTGRTRSSSAKTRPMSQNSSAAKRQDICTRTVSTNTWWEAARGRRSALTRAPRRPASTGAPWRRAASTTIRVRLSLGPPKPAPFADFEQIFSLRKSEADAFYAELQSKVVDEDLRRIQRQAFAGVLWSKQYFYYDVTEWLDGDPAEPKPPGSRHKGTQPRVGSCHHGRRRLDAGQMGVSLVRGLGLGLSSGHAGLSRSGGRQASTDPARPILVHAPQRAAAGLRMELQRRQSARAGLGGPAPLRGGAAAQRQGATGSFSSGSSPSCCSISPGG